MTYYYCPLLEVVDCRLQVNCKEGGGRETPSRSRLSSPLWFKQENFELGLLGASCEGKARALKGKREEKAGEHLREMKCLLMRSSI
jgi:hypothetical protein